jgi:hypothetical protein
MIVIAIKSINQVNNFWLKIFGLLQKMSHCRVFWLKHPETIIQGNSKTVKPQYPMSFSEKNTR